MREIPRQQSDLSEEEILKYQLGSSYIPSSRLSRIDKDQLNSIEDKLNRIIEALHPDKDR